LCRSPKRPVESDMRPTEKAIFYHIHYTRHGKEVIK
jgi:hypothetical protein